jgi:hypothetical protein
MSSSTWRAFATLARALLSPFSQSPERRLRQLEPRTCESIGGPVAGGGDDRTGASAAMNELDSSNKGGQNGKQGHPRTGYPEQLDGSAYAGGHLCVGGAVTLAR